MAVPQSPLPARSLATSSDTSASLPRELYSSQKAVASAPLSAGFFLPFPPPTRTSPLKTSCPTPIIEAALVSPSVTADLRASVKAALPFPTLLPPQVKMGSLRSWLEPSSMT
jgi:hypothetical protein